MNSGDPGGRARDERILAHVGLYHVSLRPLVERLFFAGHDARNVLGRLRAEGRQRADESRVTNLARAARTEP